jgi:hypothetical protein
MLRIVYGDSAMSKSNVFKWHKRFREGREDVYDDERQGAPVRKRTNENVEKIRELVLSGRRLSYRMIADELGMNKETVRKVLLKDLCIRKLEARPMRKNLANKPTKKGASPKQEKGNQITNDELQKKSKLYVVKKNHNYQ